ncbi:hypothetical protein [Nannocystis punicea]|uniref:Uncharacterized protein n=1 Tax=Nannocystis punicea TaxID=2995304 RepID=A0ABY7GST4_9BACT|nr:hypothetical protein [Nannocystis poenicansa]WAS89989.1 hypothetical protein O0S08_27665 [Nannocystis poenicansa]
MKGHAPTLLAGCLALVACAGELREPGPAAPPASAVATVTPAACEPALAPAPAPALTPRERRRRERGPVDGNFVFSHFSAGVFSTILIQPATYFVATRVGETGHGLGPAIGALVLGAFVPPILNYTVQWAVGRSVAPGRDRFWPGFLVNQVSHLGIFIGAVVGGADFRNLGHATAIVLGEAFLNSGLATMTAELTRRPRTPAAATATTVIVPVLEFKF